MTAWAGVVTGRLASLGASPRSDIVARVSSAPNRRVAQRVPYAEASRVLLRDSILDGMRELLLNRDWSSITLSDVARAAGVARAERHTTVYADLGPASTPRLCRASLSCSRWASVMTFGTIVAQSPPKKIPGLF